MELAQTLRKMVRRTGSIVGDLRIAYLRAAGVSIGKDCMISWGAKLDVSGGRIIIGDRCTITHGCIIPSHDRAKKRIDPQDKGQGTVSNMGNPPALPGDSQSLTDTGVVHQTFGL